MDSLPDAVRKLVQNNEEVGELWSHTFTDRILTLVDVGEHEIAKRMCRERLYEHEEISDVKYRDMEFTVITPNFHATFGSHQDSLDGSILCNHEGWAIHEPTDVEFEVEVGPFLPAVDDAASAVNANRQKGVSRGGAASAVYRRTRL